MYSRTITITDPQTGQATKFAAQFSDDEKTALESYHLYAQELASSKLLSGGVQINLTLHLPNSGPISSSQNLPPDDDLIVLLHKLRPFILNDEHASFNRVTGIIGKNLSIPYVRLLLKQQHSIYAGKNVQGIFEVQVGNRIINSDKILADWLNAFEYHRDQTKRKEIERLHALFPAEASRVFFVMLLLDKVRAIFTVANLIEVLLGKRNELQYFG